MFLTKLSVELTLNSKGCVKETNGMNVVDVHRVMEVCLLHELPLNSVLMYVLSTRSFAGPFAPLRVLLSFLTDIISDIPRKNFARIYPAIYKNFSKNFTIMCTSAFNSDVCHRLKCPLLFALRFNCNRPKNFARIYPAIYKKISKNFTIMCTSAFNYVYIRL